ncbi:uncharacterized protein LOC112343116 [Selaginella moellendorffii]|uniref:uncharacterized protein LOC112343116 n=1 Tax=Selaginella moellendorffii TaxID=88036 RepID=UPI000D1C9E86|nr:uncharacterized protein LOC112343116 [Selaginella moellendorffii]|eukprot:XP_024521828.1 uncharacterized protein LOC112343116 [Selaginella moellendorffii]
MATLTRGISFRRQGSSGMSWAENWTFTDQGMFRKQDQDPAGMEHPAALGQISAISATIDHGDAKATAQLSRSRSVGSVGSTAGTAMQIFSPVLELKDHHSLSKSTSTNTTGAATPVVELKPPIKSCPAATGKSKGFSVIRWLKKRFGISKRIGARI